MFYLNRRGPLLAALAVLALVAGLFAACGGDDDAHSDHAAVVAGLTFLENSGFHEVDEQLTLNGKIDPTAHTVAVHIQTIALGTAWPNEFKADSQQLAKAMGDFAASVDSDNPDIKKATELSNKAHTLWHAFNTKAWEHLQADAGVKNSGAAATPHSH